MTAVKLINIAKKPRAEGPGRSDHSMTLQRAPTPGLGYPVRMTVWPLLGPVTLSEPRKREIWPGSPLSARRTAQRPLSSKPVKANSLQSISNGSFYEPNFAASRSIFPVKPAFHFPLEHSTCVCQMRLTLFMPCGRML